MKLCETVFAFHHNPSATSGTDGATSNNAPCSTAPPTSNASFGEYRRMPLPMAARSLPVFMARGEIQLLPDLSADGGVALALGDSLAGVSKSFSSCLSG